jgi:uncharacterized protein (UPF0276 family)
MRGAGLGWRREIAADLLHAPEAIDLVEVTAERCFFDRRARREAVALAAIWPVVPHGVKLSLGSSDGLDEARVARLARLARDLHAPFVTEHLAFTRAAGVDVGHLTALPRTRAAVRVLAAHIARAQALLPVPLVVENVAAGFTWPEDEMGEGAFHGAIVEATGVRLLLDLSNLAANAMNEGRDPHDVVARFPLESVAMIHLAGGAFHDGFHFDTHAHPVSDLVWSLLVQALPRTGAVPLVIERDARFPPTQELVDEVARARAALAAAPAARAVSFARVDVPPWHDPHLAARQEEVARALTTVDGKAVGIDDAALARGRGILVRKRAEDAVQALGQLRERPGIEALAHEALLGAPREGLLVDARRIAARAQLEPSLARDAALDLLVLRARLHGDRPRAAPFVGRTQLPAGPQVWAWKGIGASSPVRVTRRPG